MKLRRQGRKTGPKPQFSADDVAACALKIGLADFTISQVAKALGVVPSAIYRHVQSREEIVMRALAHAGKELRLPGDELSWQEILWFISDEFWRLYQRYPGLGLALVQTPGGHVHAQRYFADVVAKLLAANFPGDRGRALFAIDFIGDTTVATAQFIEYVHKKDEEGRTGYERAREIFADSKWMPKDVEPAYPPDESWSERGFLDEKVAFIIEALETLPPRAQYSRP